DTNALQFQRLWRPRRSAANNICRASVPGADLLDGYNFTPPKKNLKKVLPCQTQLIKKSATGDFLTEKAEIMKLRSLFLALTGALILMAFIAPRANATLIVYFNFEDQAPPPSSPPPFNPGFDMVADTIAADGFGGQQNSTLTMTGYTITDFGTGPALAIAGTNRAPGDTDQTNNSALVMNGTSKNNNAFLQFSVNTIGLTQLSLSFAVDNNGNGFNTATLQYSTTPAGVYSPVATFTITTGSNQLLASPTFNVTPSATGTFRL